MAGIETLNLPFEYQNNEAEYIPNAQVIGDATQTKIDSFKARKIGAHVGSIFSINSL